MNRFQIYQYLHGTSAKIKTIYFFALIITLALCCLAPQAQADVTPQVQAAFLNLPLSFENNQGQVDSQVMFSARGPGYWLFLTRNSTVLTLSTSEERFVLRMKLLGGNPGPAMRGLQQLPGKSNYFIGSDPQKWHTNVSNYRKVKYQEVYPGVDLVYYGNQRRLEYDFIVTPGTDPGQIRIGFEGSRGIHVNENGDLVLLLSADGHEVRFRAPFTYQEKDTGRQIVASRYSITAEGEVGFDIGSYDTGHPLIIDPVLDYATYLGDSDVDQGWHITVDASGNAYVTGATKSTNFPTTGGAYNTTHNSAGFEDIFVTKFNSTGSGLIYSTFIGGSNNDRGYGIALDTSNNAYIVGSTSSINFPMVNPYDNSLGGTGDAIVAKLSSDGSSLLYSTYYGGSASEGASPIAMALDTGGNVYFTGQTGSGDLPLANAYDNSLTGPVDVYVAKINTNIPGATGLQYSTYLGGTDQAYSENPGDIGIDSSGNIYVTGNTSAIDFPTTGGAYQPARVDPGTNWDGFLVKLDPTVSGPAAMLYGTYFGGDNSDSMDGLIVDDSGVAHITGYTASTNFPTSAGAYDTSYNTGADAFIAKLNPAGGGATDLVYGTYLGGTSNDYGNDIAVDGDGKIHLAGYTGSSADFPLVNPVQGAFGGGTYDACVAILNPAGVGAADLEFSTFLGGNADDKGYGVALDTLGDIYTCGVTDAADFPATSGAYDQSYNLNTDAFVAKYKLGPRPMISSAANQTFTVGDPVTLISLITVTDDDTVASITATNDIRIRIPSGFNMVWDTSDTSATMGGAASGKVSTTVSYEDGEKTMVIDVTSDFTVSDQITISDLSFTNISDRSWPDNLELEVDDAGTVVDLDDKTLEIIPASQCVVTNTLNSGAGSLSDCITYANSNPGTTIDFNIPATDSGYQTSGGNGWWTIAPTTVFQSITGSGTVIDGTSQTYNRGNTNSQGPEIELDGNSATGLDENGLTLAGGNIIVKNLVINRFVDDGIEIEIADGNTVQGCYIGTDVTGTTARGNDYGISIKTDNNQIGGTTASARNIISGNNNYGISLYNSAANNVIEGNSIGTDATGTVDLGNTLEGVEIQDSSANNTIGGTADGEGNLIAYNDNTGVEVQATAGTGNAILGNFIYQNGALGIDLQGGTEDGFGVTANDSGDGDSGANNLQNFPVLNVAGNRSGTTTVNGTLNSTASTTFRIEFFSTAAADASGYGEGQTYLGSTSETTDGSGNVSFTFETAVADGAVISATATDPSDNTSEFSSSATVTDGIAMAVWRESGSTVPEYNMWNGTSFGTEDVSANVGEWRIMAGAESPTAGQLGEIIVAGVDGSGNINGEMWNGSSWSALSLNTLNANPVSETFWWGMDVAYEQQSGDAVLVWNNNTAGDLLQYSVWNGSLWSSKTTISAYTGGEPQQMHLAAKPQADEMMLVVSDVSANHYMLVWDGSSWGNAISVSGANQTSLYVAYEQQSGRAIVVYGKSGDPNGYYRIWNGSTWIPGEGTITAPAGVTSQAQWITLASDPNSKRIVLSVLTTGGTAADIWLNVWNGSSWGTSLLAETTASGSVHPAVAVAFESSSGQALAAYGENGQSVVRYRTWSSAGGWSAEQTDGPDIGATPDSMLLDSDPASDSDDIMLSVQDSGSTLDYVLWNGSAWGTPSEQEIDTGEVKNQPFVFLWDQVQSEKPTISSDADQEFMVDSPTTAISTITITDNSSTPTITAANDIRIRIPSGFNMSWDTSDTTATIGGGASGKVSTTVSYEDSGKTLVISVITDFVATDEVTITDLGFTSFTGPSPADNLELEVTDDDAVSAYDDKSITINSPMKLFTGSYTGNGTAGTTITGLGFQPDVVIIKASDDTQEAACRTSSMGGDVSKPMGGATALAAYLIQSLDSDGFTIGNDDRVNQSGTTYHWVAFQAGAGEMTVNSYTGTGVDGTSVAGVGFQPNYVIVMSALAREPVHRSSTQSGDTTLFFDNTAAAANHIQTLEVDGFQVGDDARVNTLNETYHYIAWKAVTGKMAVGLHPGDGNDDTNITGLGFEPEYVIHKQNNNKEAVHRPASLSGDNTLWFVPNISASNMIQQLQSDGFQVGNSDMVNKNGEAYFWVAFAGSHLTMASAADQTFNVGDPLTAISTITITEGVDAPTITALDDIRIRIPASFNMTWDTADPAAVIGGAAAAKVAPAVIYEDSGLTLVLDVLADFAAGDQITVSGLSFTGFTATSAPDNLELEVENDGTAAAYDKKTIRIVGPLSISSAADQVFTLDDPATAAATIAVTDDFAMPQITAGNELRIRIPTGFNMTWDTSVTTVTIGGSAAAKVSTTVQAYEDGGRTLVLDVTSNFAAGEYITLAGAQFTDFSAVSPAANLEVDVNADAAGDAFDDKIITLIEEPSISSAADQVFAVGDPATAIETITITDATAGTPMITAANDIRIRIPSGFSMTWDTTNPAATIGGGASGKVDTAVTYEDGGLTLVLDVITDFAAGDQITVSGLSFTNFSASSQVDQLELEVNDDDAVTDLDDKTIKILDPADGDKDINPVENLELIPAGSLVIAMDNDKQIADGSAFNLNAYGLVNSLLWDEIPVKWAIDTGKAKDGIDFSSEAQRIFPSTLAAATLDFRGGPFIIHEYWAADAQPKIAAFGNDVAVYRLTEDVNVDIRYTLTHKSKVGVLSDGGNAAIHNAILAAAGFVADTHYETILAASLLTVNADSCFTFVSEPHWGEDDPASDPQAEAIRSFVESGGNFLAQCEAVLSYENNTAYGLFQTTNGFINNDLGDPNVIYASPDISYSQIQGELDATQGGSLEDFTLAVGSSFHNNGHIHVHNTPETDRYVATASKLTVGIGSNVYYLGGHQYAGDTLEQINGKRMYLNAVLTPSGRPTDCLLNFPADMIQPSISSAINQFFIQGEPPVAISTITIIDDEDTPTITAANDIRIRIPAGFSMTWDTSDTTAVIGGGAAGKVSDTVSYEDGGKTLVINVTSDFAADDQITIAGLSFMDFSGPSSADKLELEVADDGTAIATDDKTISIGPPEISSAANQTFSVGDPPTAISTITITEADTGTSMTAAKDIRIRIPDGLNMTWDTTDTTAVLGGSAAAKVSTTVSYEDSDKILVLDVLTDFAPSEDLTVSNLSFANFIAVSAPDNLGLEVRNDGYIQATDDKTITIADINISSAADQTFAVNDPATADSPITITDDSNSPLITAADDIRIHIPAGFNMTWDTADTTAVISGPAAAKVSGTVTYEDGGKTLVLDVTSDFAAWDQVTVSGLSFTGFTAASAADNLALEVYNDDTTVATDDKTIAVGAPTISSAADQTFYEADPPTAISTITVTDDGSTPTITSGSDIRIRIPAGFSMTWDTSDTTATIGGAASAKVSTTVTYEDGGQTLVLDVTSDFAAGDQITIAGLSFTGFGASADDNLELEVNNAGTVAAEDDKTIAVHSRMKIRTGSYTGDGTAGTLITGLKFQPDVVIIKVADDNKEGVIRTSSMSDDVSKPMGDATALEADLIQSLDPDGFTIGGDDRVNKSGKTYHWIAFEAGDGEMVVDSYTGNKIDDTSITGVGFQPDYVMVLPAINKEPVHRSSEQSGDSTMYFLNLASVANHVQALEADGFQVGNDDRVNKLDQTYHYIAWKEVAGKMAVGTHAGNGTDGTEISGLGFAPEYVIMKQDNAKEAVHRPDSLSGDNTLWFMDASQSADMIQELQSDGFQLGQDDIVNKSGENYFWMAFAGEHLRISSESNQSFHVNDPAQAISTITITEDYLDPTITVAKDIRIRIPAGFNMTWDTTDTTAIMGSGAAGKVSETVTYEDGGQTLVISVTTDFSASDQLTISGLSFTNFSGRSTADNLELEVDNGDTVAAVDDKTIAVVAPTISSAANQYFIVGSPAQAVQTITITEDSYGPSITAADDIRIRIPAGFNMTWDTSDTTAVIGGSAAGKVSATVSYEDGGRTLVIDATGNFAASDQITIADLSFSDFTAASLPDNLELEVKNDGLTAAIDDKTIAIGDISISSADTQEFIVGDAATAVSTITITEDSTAAIITAANDIRIRIPDDFYMLWDTSDLLAAIGGTASSKVSTTVSYEDGGKTLVLDVTSDFAASDQITISGLNFTNFTEASFGDRLELEVFNDGATVAEDDKWKAIGGAPSVAGTMLVYGEGSVITPRSRSWQGAPSLSFSAEASANNTDDVIKWVVLKPSPTTNEMILGTYSSADKNLYIQTWDGTSWTSNWNITTSYNDTARFFDIAYEKNSGDVMVVFGERSDNSLRYRKRVDGTWDSSDQIISEISSDNDIFWVKAESRPGSDDIFVAAVSGSKSLYALRWDGTSNSWGDSISMLAAAGVKNQNTEGFDIAFESTSGDAFLIWGDVTANVKYREFTTAWQSENTAYASMGDDAYWLAAAYDPRSTSSNIAIGMMREDGQLEFGAWNGTAWTTRPAAIAANSRDQRTIDVAFESDTGQALYAFSQKVNTDDEKKLAWRSWTSTGGFSSVTVLPNTGTPDEIKFVQLKADPLSDDIMAVYADKAKDLYYRFWDGSTWTALTAPLEAELSDEDMNEAFMFAWKESPPTAIDLISFSATGKDAAVEVTWQTAREIDNLGFYLYRAAGPAGPFNRLTEQLIPGSALSVQNRGYRYIDRGAVPGNLYYYRLEDVDSRGKLTRHGPICVDWDADGMPDDWEIARGLDPTVNDADLDPDGDGFSNLDEYRHHTDPLNPDTDGDGILDGADDGRLGQAGHHSGRGLGRGVELLETDASGLTLELRTTGFETTVIEQDGREFDRLRIADYVHGYTAETGRPQMPIKGILVDVPPDMSASLSILATDVQIHAGYQVYPVPANQAEQNESGSHVADRFVIDEAAYSQNAFYPWAAARLGETYVFRGQTKQQVVFHPLAVNPFTGQMIQYRRIRLRVNFTVDPHRTAAAVNPAPWQPPKAATSLEPPAATAALAGVWSLPSVLGSPILSALLSLGGLSAAVWGPPADSGEAVYKIMLSEAGIYRVDRPFMSQQGLADSAIDAIDLSRVRLYHLGRELAVYVNDLGTPDFFDVGDYLEFYGRPVETPYAKYTADNVYWLVTDGGSGTPWRMAAVDGTPQGANLAATHLAVVRHEENKLPWLAAPGDDELERWFFMATVSGDGVQGGGSAVNYKLNLPAVAGDGRLTITLYGAYDTDHAVTVAVNGATQGTFNWRGIATTTVEISGLALQENNVIALQCLTDLDTIYVDAFEALYPKNYYAAADALKFSHPTGYRFLIDNLAGSGPAVYDITADDDVRRIWGFDQSAGSPYHVEFEPPDDTPSGEARTWLVVTDDGVKTPAAMLEDSPSNLADTQNSADFILITLRDLGWEPGGSERPWLDQLTARRRDQGLTVTAVAVEDIYDEFGYGRSGPYAVRDFLAYTFSDWTAPAPRYVLLVGDGTYDPKNRWRWYLADTTAYLPTYLTFTEYKGETVSDDWLACISGADALPDLYIGRLPAKDAADAAVMVDKILNYETTANTKGWEKNAVFVADNRLPGDEHAYETIFETINEDAAALLPTGFNAPFHGYLNDYAASAYLTDDLKNQVNNPGALIVNYAGHGSTQIWAEEQIFKTSDVADLANAAMLPFVIGMSCETGYFAYPEPWYFPSLTEALLRSTAGAVAALMPSGMTTTGGQHILNSALFDAIFSEDTRQLGPAVAAAKQTLLANLEPYYEEISMTFLLFGDPAMELKVPLPHRPAELEAAGQTHAISLQWQAAVDCNGQAVEGYNLYRSITAGGPYDKLNATPLTATAYLDAAALPDGDVRAAVAAISTNTPYYYVVKSVDVDGDESVSSRQVSAAAASLPPIAGQLNTTKGGSGGGGGGVCFITAAAGTTESSFFVFEWPVSSVFGLLALIGLLWLGKKRRG